MAPDQTSERKAALLLHSLPGPARQEVLARLDSGRRDALLPLLDELQGLGIPTGHAWIDLSQQRDESRQRQLAWNLGSAQAAAILTGQSLETVAAVLGLAPWPWTDELLAQWPADQRTRLVSLTASTRTLPAPVAESLLASLADKVSQLALQPGAPSLNQRAPRPSWLRRVLGKSSS
jgi:Mg/Co/Ni transporter MgtE